ncbi:hypothetical protein [Planctomicrobium piriforme]|uniref:DUF4019 domain-containing protein n=1 Tax=Planctomicrobium piriforme TaxID=1576369 RepID=A0A1I3LNM1_9PLAN|nr:hypothetical protein [Planctomicrobium piriforme]SFI86297.1 hypothetical protein SAMN05421753_11318 [Planctomicrobium piriforme]
MTKWCCLFIVTFAALPVLADEAPAPAAPAVEMNAAEKKFSELLTGANLVGSFTSDRAWEAAPRSEMYGILSASKVKDEQWIVQAKMSYKNVEVPIPVPVQVYWAGDTPMLQVTNLTIPLLGDGFFARVLFYEDRYAGTWQHGKAGGHLFGRVEKSAATTKDAKPLVPVEQDKAAP